MDKELIIKLENDSAIIVNLQSTTPELQEIGQYLQNKSDKKISIHELEAEYNSHNNTTNPLKIALWMGCGVGMIVIIAIVIRLLKKKSSLWEKQSLSRKPY